MSLIKNSVWNFLSIIIPSLVALPAFAVIARVVGIEIFGIFTLSFAIVGYASIFDLGLSRSVIREIAIHCQQPEAQVLIINTATTLIVVLGLLSSIALWITAAPIVDFIKVSHEHIEDVTTGLKLLALCLPPLLLSQVWLSYFEGLEQFKKLSYIKVVIGIATVLLPLIFCLIESNFKMLMFGLIASRFLAFFISLYLISKHIPLKLSIDRVYAENLLNFGGWLTISSIVGPIVVYFDRFILSSVIGAKYVAFYTVPAELIMRLIALPSAVSRTLFPRMSQASSERKSEKYTYYLSLKLLALSALIIGIPLYIFAEEIMGLWMGQAFRGQPVEILRILLIGFFINALAQVPFTQLQAHGYSKVTALVHVIEALPYLIVLTIIINMYGIIGVAWTWTTRIFIDTIIFFYLNNKYVG